MAIFSVIISHDLTYPSVHIPQLSSGYILRYVRAVKLVQRKVREYLKSQADLMRALEKVWDAVEYKYITVRERM